MAATTDNVKERAEKTIGVEHGKNIEEVEKHIEKKFYKINELYNNEKDQSNSNKKDKSNSNEIEASLWAGGDEQNKPIPLTLFGIYRYGDKNGTHDSPGNTISKSALPMGFVTYQEGEGKIISIKIDGEATNLYTYEKKALEIDEYRRAISLAQEVKFNNSLIANLSNGVHTVDVICSSRDRYTTYGTDLADNFTFNLVD